MESNEYILDLIKDLIDHDVKFIVCGGVAVVLQGVERLTMDLGLSLDMTTENLEKFLAVIKKNKLTSRAPIPEESILDEEILDTIVEQKNATVFTFIDNANPYRQIDVFITKDKSYKAIVEDSEEVALGDDYVIRIASVDKLIAMKKEISPLRDKDRYDIKRLEELKEANHEK